MVMERGSCSRGTLQNLYLFFQINTKFALLKLTLSNVLVSSFCSLEMLFMKLKFIVTVNQWHSQSTI